MKLAEHGILGLLLFVVGWAYYQKDKALASLQKEWRQEQAESSDKMLAIAQETNQALERLEQVSRHRAGLTDMTR